MGRPTFVVGIGASAGGIEPLRRVVGALPADFSGAICVVLHIPATGSSLLATILDREGPLDALTAADGMPLEAGKVYVAPADSHLLVESRVLRLSRGPKQNGVRPAVDPLLRTLATVHGPRCAAVILSGALDDGASGVTFVHDGGGAVLVQDPEEAAVPSMPVHARKAVPGAEILAAHAIAARLHALAGSSPPPGGESAVRADETALEPTTARRPIGGASGFTCPECSGALWEIREGRVLRYRCRVGHAYSEQAFGAEQGPSGEAAPWTALHVLEERVELLGKLASRSVETGRTGTAERSSAAVEVARGRAELIRRVIVEYRDEPLVRDDAAQIA